MATREERRTGQGGSLCNRWPACKRQSCLLCLSPPSLEALLPWLQAEEALRRVAEAEAEAAQCRARVQELRAAVAMAEAEAMRARQERDAVEAARAHAAEVEAAALEEAEVSGGGAAGAWRGYQTGVCAYGICGCRYG